MTEPTCTPLSDVDEDLEVEDRQLDPDQELRLLDLNPEIADLAALESVEERTDRTGRR